MEDYHLILKRVGWALIVVGIVDIGFMIYCIVHGISYSSSFNIFAVVAGALFLRGHLGTVRVVTWFSAFMLVGFVGVMLLFVPFVNPLDLWLIQLRLHTLNTLMSLVLGLFAVGFVYWVYRQLRSPAVVQARVAVGHSASAPKWAFVAGALLVLTLTVAMQFSLRGEAGKRAVQLAEAKMGPNYRYAVSSMNWSGEHGSSRITAYNDHEIKSVDVQW